MVAPHLVKPEHPLYAVNGVFNAVMVHGNMVDDVMFYGRGAGSHATASAVMADVVEEAANLGKTLSGILERRAPGGSSGGFLREAVPGSRKGRS